MVDTLTDNPSTATHTYADGPYTYEIHATATNEDGTFTKAGPTVSVTNVAPINVSVDLVTQTKQYSDQITTVTVQATDVPADTLSIATQWSNDGVDFTNGLPDAGSIAGGLILSGAGGAGSGTWTLSGLADLAPDTYTIRFIVSDEDGGSTSQDTTIVVAKEDALADYTGAVFASTSSVTSTKATVTLSATIRDITAASGDRLYDAYSGDIRKATVTFINRETNSVIASGIAVGLVNTGDLKTGTATYNWSVDLGNADSATYTIGVIVDNYYTRNDSEDDTVVNISKPITTGFITGGGYLTLTDSAGLKAGDAGTKANFGFNVKFNKTGKNLQGNINTIIRRTESDGIVHVYQVKGNVMTSLSTPTTSTAIFNGKASIQDITNPLVPISVDGNTTLQVTMTDKGEPGSADTISITVWNKSGGLWFASSWNGTKTVEQTLAGGNLVVRKALQAADGESLQGAVGTTVLTQELLEPIIEEAIAQWRDAGADPKLLHTASKIAFQITDLPGADLGEASAAGVILIDKDAAGYGWFVDPTPADNSEFVSTANGQLQAIPGSTAFGEMDLLTVISHEIGHLLGYDHATSWVVMDQDLETGTRALPQPATDAVAPGKTVTMAARESLVFDEVHGVFHDLLQGKLVDSALGSAAAHESSAFTDRERKEDVFWLVEV